MKAEGRRSEQGFYQPQPMYIREILINLQFEEREREKAREGDNGIKERAWQGCSFTQSVSVHLGFNDPLDDHVRVASSPLWTLNVASCTPFFWFFFFFVQWVKLVKLKLRFDRERNKTLLLPPSSVFSLHVLARL